MLADDPGPWRYSFLSRMAILLIRIISLWVVVLLLLPAHYLMSCAIYRGEEEEIRYSVLSIINYSPPPNGPLASYLHEQYLDVQLLVLCWWSSGWCVRDNEGYLAPNTIYVVLLEYIYFPVDST